jgi:hypothetical protein
VLGRAPAGGPLDYPVGTSQGEDARLAKSRRLPPVSG